MATRKTNPLPKIPHNHFIRYKTSDEIAGDKSYMFLNGKNISTITFKGGINIVTEDDFLKLLDCDMFNADLADGILEDVARYENTVEGILELPKSIKLKVISDMSYKHLDFLVSWQASDVSIANSVKDRIKELEAKRELQVTVSAKKLY